ncbi:N-acetylmuramoyl-L-alanine amidase CwlD [Petroclostridium sp. X23]|uniref:N-acetylmuramoyl-L-alanine amidase CwlD n=1 Tax=Petroclostridium sp. X23 TaxID=3045146 RepID=UPI0024AE7DCD|nr:N-acetylmuramoyl-L-alanine amidase CwlD [Petroclostridium sp. X23]WHH61328.1 N-acetylmuramoyl-L-alanine amidase CwlD [Petroclostridium sp. X23]
MVKRTNLLLIILICILSYMTFNLYTQNDNIPTIALPTTNRIIIIDAGHGYPDGGASGKTSGVLEMDINLKIAQKLQALLEQSGGTVVLTRADDNSIHDADKNTIRSKKNSDLRNRKSIMEQSQADAFISIHLNQFEQSKYYGAQVFYSTNDEQSKVLGEVIQKELIEGVDNGNNRKAKPATSDIYLLREASIPAVVVECGFLSNPKEEELLQSDSYQKKLAWSMYVALIKYFNTLQ